jgi:hypothetical protein
MRAGAGSTIFSRATSTSTTPAKFHIFIQKHFLYWLEALSLMGNMSDRIVMMRALESMLRVSSSIRSRYNVIKLINKGQISSRAHIQRKLFTHDNL